MYSTCIYVNLDQQTKSTLTRKRLISLVSNNGRFLNHNLVCLSNQKFNYSFRLKHYCITLVKPGDLHYITLVKPGDLQPCQLTN